MSYFGRQPAIGSYKKLDILIFDDVATIFTLQSGGVNIVPGSPQNLIVSVGGVIQEPGIAYTVSGSTIIFTEVPSSLQSFWGVLLGDVLDVGFISSGVDISVGNTVIQKTLSANGSIGTSGQVLTSSGSANVYWATSSVLTPGWERQQTRATATGQSSITISGLDLATDLVYEFIVQARELASGGAYLGMQVNGSATADNVWSATRVNAGTPAASQGGSGSDTAIMLSAGYTWPNHFSRITVNYGEDKAGIHRPHVLFHTLSGGTADLDSFSGTGIKENDTNMTSVKFFVSASTCDWRVWINKIKG